MDAAARTPDPLEIRMAKLEGGYDQIDKRISALETDLTQGLSDIRAEIRNLRTPMFSLNGLLALLITVFAYLTRN